MRNLYYHFKNLNTISAKSPPGDMLAILRIRMYWKMRQRPLHDFRTIEFFKI